MHMRTDWETSWKAGLKAKGFHADDINGQDDVDDQ